ncbi:MAG: acyl carrier protein [Acidobacteriaceae bacterium]|nr:acyl carrier protein [Acidobacteriaceae bacterium]MBV9297030.1 acyl carrier protein [Acidobacteriaceae bacterium]MBV9763724.1 acyl carrier protein [Acidobacteriaceae bacterium]
MNSITQSDQLNEELRSIVAGVGGISPDFDSKAHLYNDLGVPSVKALHLLLTLEERYGISIDDDEFVEATSLDSLRALIARLLG